VSRNERVNKILEAVSKAGSLDVDDAARQLGVSVATIRRDFDELSNRQLVVRTHGGIQAIGGSYDLPIRYKTSKANQVKQHIARHAMAMVKPGMVLGMNGGTTTTECARSIGQNPAFQRPGGDIGLTVVTNAINIATELVIRPHIKIVVTGGVARPHSYELTGEWDGGLLDSLTLDIAFMGVNAVNPIDGAMAQHEGEALINKKMADAANRVVVVTTSDKIGTRAFAKFCPVNRIHTLVTDSGISSDMVSAWEAEGVEIVIA
jgi:DeoR family transcriptional regulator of aga operon